MAYRVGNVVTALWPVNFLQLAEDAGLQVVLSGFTPKEQLSRMLPTLGVAEQ